MANGRGGSGSNKCPYLYLKHNIAERFCRYHLPLRVLLLPGGGEISYHRSNQTDKLSFTTMKHTYTSLCTAALLMLAACTNDPAEDLLSSNDTRPDALPEGTFVVDYLPSADLPATRRLGEDEVILSLDYLLYASTNGTTYTLQKHTSISDINAYTPWPLTRESMTWQQRQELKDTLNTNSQYKVVFVANADKKVWNDKTDFQPMTGVDVNTKPTFDQARLLLPPNGDFQQQEDGKYTFYYMWTGEIDPTTNGYNKNTPAQMDVVLQRMVNKVEIRLADEVVQGIAESENVDEYVEKELKQFYTDNYVNEQNTGALDKTVWEYVAGLNNVLEEDGTIATPKKVTTHYFKTNYTAKNKKEKSIVNNISTCTQGNECTAENPICVMHTFIQNTKNTYKALCDWSTLEKIEISYESQSYPQAINFNKETVNDGTTTSSIIAYLDKVSQHCIFYTFGNNQSGNEQNMNKIKSMTFKANNEKELFTSENVNIIPGYELTQGNRHILLIYNPSASKQVSDDATFQFDKAGFNLQNVWGWNYDNEEGNASKSGFYFALGYEKGDFESWLNSGLHEIGVTDTETFNNMTLTLNIPNLEWKDLWTTEEYKSAATE